MPPTKMFILDSNVYFRLALSIHPLLGQPFGTGDEKHVLRVISQLDAEYNRNSRLQHKFHWVGKKEYRENRQNELLVIAGKQKATVDQVRSFIIQTERDIGSDLSLVDATALAVGFVKQQPVVTDDKDMCAVANLLGIEVWSLLQLLKIMLSEGHIDLEKVKEVAQLLDYENDLPCGRNDFTKQFKQFFGTNPFN